MRREYIGGWRGAGAVERGGLENRCAHCGHRGFESLPLRLAIDLVFVCAGLRQKRLCTGKLFC